MFREEEIVDALLIQSSRISYMEVLLILVISFTVSVVSGMLGLGGAVVLIPAYLYIPSLFGYEAIGIKEISGVTSLQVFAVSAFGTFLHRQRGAVDRSVVFNMGLPITATSFVGAMLSGGVHPDIILGIFAVLAVLGAVLAISQIPVDHGEPGFVHYNKNGARVLAGIVGFFGGMVGAPGAFIISPLMMTLLKIPTRVTIGSALGIVLLSSFAASIGKLMSGLVPFSFTIAAIGGSLPGVILGSVLSHKVTARKLRIGLAAIIGAVGIQMWYKILSQ